MVNAVKEEDLNLLSSYMSLQLHAGNFLEGFGVPNAKKIEAMTSL